jgi:arylsulfatase A-like enzyme
MLEQRWERPREATDAEHPNIVFVVMDTLRADRVTVDGYARPTSPALERLAARGISWRDAYATAPWTWPSTATLLTGLMPEEHGVESEVACWLPSELDTLAEALQQAGYTTAAWSTNPLVGPEKNFEQGFEFFDHARSTFRDGDLVMPAVLEWLGTMDGTRFFLYLHLTDPHAPHDPLPASRTLLARDVPTDWDQDRFEERQWALLGGEAHTPQGVLETERVVPKDEQRYTNEIYDACVHTGDHWLGLLLDRIDELGLAGDTVVVFTSDHGEELFDHGLLGHSHDLHAESIRVPLVIAGPGIPAGERRTAPVSLRHVAPTLARIGGASLGNAPGAARDLVRDGGPEDVFFSTQQGWWNGFRPVSMYGVRRGDLVLHYVPSGGPWGAAPTPGGAVRLFDVAADPEERHDLAAERPELVGELKRAILEHLAALERRRRASRVRAGSATEALLKRLGYAGGN